MLLQYPSVTHRKHIGHICSFHEVASFQHFMSFKHFARLLSQRSVTIVWVPVCSCLKLTIYNSTLYQQFRALNSGTNFSCRLHTGISKFLLSSLAVVQSWTGIIGLLASVPISDFALFCILILVYVHVPLRGKRAFDFVYLFDLKWKQFALELFTLLAHDNIHSYWKHQCAADGIPLSLPLL